MWRDIKQDLSSVIPSIRERIWACVQDTVDLRTDIKAFIPIAVIERCLTIFVIFIINKHYALL